MCHRLFRNHVLLHLTLTMPLLRSFSKFKYSQNENAPVFGIGETRKRCNWRFGDREAQGVSISPRSRGGSCRPGPRLI
jgi:hypothetical protein